MPNRLPFASTDAWSLVANLVSKMRMPFPPDAAPPPTTLTAKHKQDAERARDWPAPICYPMLLHKIVPSRT